MVHVVVVGNPGVGKSFVLNAIFGTPTFKSGLQLCDNMTTHLASESIGSVRYTDTPGLDNENEAHTEHAAAEISRAFGAGGDFQLVFVCTLESGRLREAHVKALHSILCALENAGIKPAGKYSVLVNHCESTLVEQLQDERKRELLRAMFCTRMPLFHLGFLPEVPEATSSADYILQNREGVARFIREAPTMHVPYGSVIRIVHPPAVDGGRFDTAFGGADAGAAGTASVAEVCRGMRDLESRGHNMLNSDSSDEGFYLRLSDAVPGFRARLQAVGRRLRRLSSPAGVGAASVAGGAPSTSAGYANGGRWDTGIGNGGAGSAGHGFPAGYPGGGGAPAAHPGGPPMGQGCRPASWPSGQTPNHHVHTGAPAPNGGSRPPHFMHGGGGAQPPPPLRPRPPGNPHPHANQHANAHHMGRGGPGRPGAGRYSSVPGVPGAILGGVMPVLGAINFGMTAQDFYSRVSGNGDGNGDGNGNGNDNLVQQPGQGGDVPPDGGAGGETFFDGNGGAAYDVGAYDGGTAYDPASYAYEYDAGNGDIVGEVDVGGGGIAEGAVEVLGAICDVFNGFL